MLGTHQNQVPALSKIAFQLGEVHQCPRVGSPEAHTELEFGEQISVWDQDCEYRGQGWAEEEV